MTEQALADLKVIELAEFVGGPYCTKMLADLGAEVIKVEKPGVGDIARRLGPFPDDVPHPEKSGLFLYLNSNKLGVTLNIETATGRKILKQLIEDADVFVESNPRKMMGQLGLDYESLKEINPKLVMVSITPWGYTGPYRGYKGYDINIMAGSMLMSRLGFPDREPVTMPAYQGGYYSGLNAAAAAIIALHHRDFVNPGTGQHIDLSQVRCFATHFSLQATIFTYTKSIDRRAGRQFPGAYPYTVFECQDGAVLIGAVDDRSWQCLLEIMGNPEWAKDDICGTAYSRYKNRKELAPKFESWAAGHTKDDFLCYMKENQGIVPFAPLQTVDQLMKSEHLQDREFFVDCSHPMTGTLRYPGAPYKLSATPWRIRLPAPLLGEHNEAVYCNRMGYSNSDLVKLRQTGVI